MATISAPAALGFQRRQKGNRHRATRKAALRARCAKMRNFAEGPLNRGSLRTELAGTFWRLDRLDGTSNDTSAIVVHISKFAINVSAPCVARLYPVSYASGSLKIEPSAGSTSCQGTKSSAMADQYYDGVNLVPATPGARVTFMNNFIDGSPGCGALLGNYILPGTRLKASVGWLLGGYCPGEFKPQNDGIIKALSGERTVERDDQRMVLRDAQETIQVILRP
jgi:hypothetical protein